MKKFTKKDFRAALKANDRTEVWHLAAVKIGRKPKWLEVCNLIENVADTQKDRKKAWNLTFNGRNEEKRVIAANDVFLKRGGFRQYDAFHYRSVALQMLRRLLTENPSNYTKVPMMGHTHLYFCHPGYGHADYNKVRTCAIEGNEAFCENICKIAKRHLEKMEAA